LARSLGTVDRFLGDPIIVRAEILGQPFGCPSKGRRKNGLYHEIGALWAMAQSLVRDLGSTFSGRYRTNSQKPGPQDVDHVISQYIREQEGVIVLSHCPYFQDISPIQ